MPDLTSSLGIPLIKPRMAMEHYIGVRYWSIDDEGRLGAPLRSGQPWDAGLNKGRCGIPNCKSGTTCACGLYCFHYEEGLTATHYFNLATGAIAGPMSGNAIIGAIAYWLPSYKVGAGDIVCAKFAAVAALTLVPNAGKALRAKVELAAERYGVEIIEHTQITSSVDSYVESRLPSFYDPPLAPLFDILKQAPTTAFPHTNHWGFTPRGHRERAMA